MRILLLAPPLNSLTHPYSSLPALTGFLRRSGHETHQCDLGMAAMDATLSRQGIEALKRRISQNLTELTPGEETTPRSTQLREALLYADEVANRIDEEKMMLRCKESFYDPHRYQVAKQIVERALELITAAYPKIRFEADSLNVGIPPTFDNIRNFVNDPDSNPFGQVMREALSSLLATHRPQIVGISVTYPCQLFFGYAMARMVREWTPEALIVMGGAAINLAEDTFRRFPERTFTEADAYCFGEGEGPLENLLALIEHPESTRNQHQNLFLSPDVLAQYSIPSDLSRSAPVYDLNDLPSPDYSGLELERYLAPEILFLLGNTRSCYYGKCTFCSCSYGHQGRYQIRSMPNIGEDLKNLHERQGARHVFFTDDAIPPKRCKEIAQFLNSGEMRLSWSGEMRYERMFGPELIDEMARSGCCYVAFGNESASIPVLERMHKGTSPELSIEVIHLMAAAGIGIDLQNFIGFPGETEAQALETLQFLLCRKDEITTCSLGTYFVSHGSPVALNPEQFGVHKLTLKDSANLIPSYSYQVEDGLAPNQQLITLRDRFVDLLSMAYPANNFFLDGSVGSHNTLYHAHYDNQNVRKHLSKARPLFQSWDDRDKSVWAEGVRWLRFDDNTATIFHAGNGRLIRLQDESEVIDILISAESPPPCLCETRCNRRIVKRLRALLNRLHHAGFIRITETMCDMAHTSETW